MPSASPFYTLLDVSVVLKEAIRKDIEKLLNTRCRCLKWPEQLNQLDKSVVSYGLPSFLSQQLSDDAAQNDFCKIIEKVLTVHEPRLSDLQVRLNKNKRDKKYMFAFTISGFINLPSEMESFLFDSYLSEKNSDFVLL